MNCIECKYRGGDGSCHRFPPSGRPSCWPTVHAMDWCGEFQPLVPPPKRVVRKEPPEPVMLPVLEEGVPTVIIPKGRMARRALMEANQNG